MQAIYISYLRESASFEARVIVASRAFLSQISAQVQRENLSPLDAYRKVKGTKPPQGFTPMYQEGDLFLHSSTNSEDSSKQEQLVALIQTCRVGGFTPCRGTGVAPDFWDEAMEGL